MLSFARTAEMVRGGGSPTEIVERRSLRQVSDPGTLAPLVDQVIAANADEYPRPDSSASSAAR